MANDSDNFFLKLKEIAQTMGFNAIKMRDRIEARVYDIERRRRLKVEQEQLTDSGLGIGVINDPLNY